MKGFRKMEKVLKPILMFLAYALGLALVVLMWTIIYYIVWGGLV